jgi:Fe-S cluster biogenesis protein NfuA
MDLKKYIEDSLAPLSPVLKEAGKSIEVSLCEPPKVVFQLTGFCGGCECSSSYKDGLRELVLGNCPEITDVQFVDR